MARQNQENPEEEKVFQDFERFLKTSILPDYKHKKWKNIPEAALVIYDQLVKQIIDKPDEVLQKIKTHSGIIEKEMVHYPFEIQRHDLGKHGQSIEELKDALEFLHQLDYGSHTFTNTKGQEIIAIGGLISEMHISKAGILVTLPAYRIVQILNSLPSELSTKSNS